VGGADDTSEARENIEYMLDFGRSFSGHERHCAYLNTGGDRRAEGRFACVSSSSGLDLADDGRAVAVVDWDHDGDQDLWISNRTAPRLRFLRNDTPRGSQHYLQLRLVGNGTTTNRDAIGARVELMVAGTGDLPRVKTLRAGEGFLAQSSKWLHFGLGRMEEVTKAIVRWPGGEVEEFVDLRVDRRYELVQGTGHARDLPFARPASELAASTPIPAKIEGKARIPLIPLVRLPAVFYTGRDGGSVSLPAVNGKPMLINCWSAACRPCIEELKDITKRAEEIRAAGIQVLALSLDDGVQDGSGAGRDYELLASLGFPFTVGRANDELNKVLSLMHNSLTAIARPLPVPTSFLIDESGRLSVIYKGPLSVDQLLVDVAHASRTSTARYREAAHFEGTIIAHPVTQKTLAAAEIRARLDVARFLQRLGREREAIAQASALVDRYKTFSPARVYLAQLLVHNGQSGEALRELEEAAAVDPASGKIQRLLGDVLRKLGRTGDAVERYRKAIELMPESADAHESLGQVLADLERWSEAQEAFAESVRLRPGDAFSHLRLAVAYAGLGNEPLAEQHFREAIRIKPDLTEAHERLGQLLGKLARWQQAAEQFEIVATQRPRSPEAHYNLGVALVKQEKRQQAIMHFEEALRIRPDFPQARRYLQLCREAGQPLGK